MNKEKLECYHYLLPLGTMKIVAQKAGVTTQSVRNYLNGRNNSVQIEDAILDVIAELQEERKER